MVKWWIPPLETGETVVTLHPRAFSAATAAHNNETQSNIAYAA